MDIELDPRLSVEVRERVPKAMQRAQEITAAAKPSRTAKDLLAAARRASTGRQRVIWLQRWASAVVEPLVADAACRKGCAHCCHIPAAITSAEARLLAEVSGKFIAKPKLAISIQALQDGDGSALAQVEAMAQVPAGKSCPFLANGSCSVYAHRPVACRVHLSLDEDDLLCRLVEGVTVPVPYVDTRLLSLTFWAAQRNEVLADIRDFFPNLGSPKGDQV